MSVPMNVRKALPAAKMGDPADNKYPMPDKAHAANAKARARQQLNKGNLTWTAYKAIVRKADAILGKAAGSKK